MLAPHLPRKRGSAARRVAEDVDVSPAVPDPQEFVAKWRTTTLSERSAYQQHFLDLCRLIGHPTPADLDASGASFTFEAGATKRWKTCRTSTAAYSTTIACWS